MKKEICRTWRIIVIRQNYCNQNMKHFFISVLLLFSLFPSWVKAETCEHKNGFEKIEKRFRFRVRLTDKKNNPYRLSRPEEFLSPKSLERRKRLGLKVDSFDLPITPRYLSELKKTGVKIFNQSKWNNTVVVEVADSALMKCVRALPFVKGTRCVWEGPDSVRTGSGLMIEDRRAIVTDKRDSLPHYYGHSAKQVEMLGVDRLHRDGYTGKNVTIAVIDGGFFNADVIAGLKELRILGTKNFAVPGTDTYAELDHGMMVLSCIGSNQPHFLVGTAPGASFYLIQSEDGRTEQLVEEDNWCAAVEYADSVGCDMITSSLGYTQFDHHYMNHRYYEADGRTALNSRSASLAASRGLLLLNSAGNSGTMPWKKICFPGDATDILTVGAVDSVKVNTVFSSVGNTADHRVKPDVMAMGQACAVYNDDGSITKVNGTSFSCPILCGAVACLLQAYPTKTPVEVMNAVRLAGDNVAHPDNIYGYGIPDMNKAFRILKQSAENTK